MSRKGKEVVGASSGKRKRGEDGGGGRTNDLNGGGGGRRRKNRGVLMFFDDAADEAEESDMDDECDFDNDFIEENYTTDKKANSVPAGVSSLPVFPKEELIDEEEFDRMMEERYKDGAGFVTYAGDDYEDKLVEVPSAKDPTIWKVKCMAGRERHSAFCLMQKFVHLKSLGNVLKMISAFAMDHVKGFIFVEAEKQGDINEACNGLPNIYFTRVQPVPVNEVSRLLNAPSKYNKISEGMWARVKNGRYKGDLAQVFAVNDAKRRATVRLIPRIDLDALAAKFGGGLSLQKNVSPAPRLITSSDLEKFRPLIQYKRDQDTGKYFEVLDGMMLKDGYLFKKVSVDSLSFWGVEPNQEELLKFAFPENDSPDDLEWLSQLYGEQKKKRVITSDKGDEKGESTSGLTVGNGYEMLDLVCFNRKDFGVIIGLEKDDSYKILKDGPDGPLALSVQRRDMKCGLFDLKLSALDKHGKTILIDDTVRVTEGTLEGKQGLVKRIYKGIVFFHDENEVDNGGYLCCKSHMCEKIGLSICDFSGKDDGPGPSCFDDFPVSPNSPLPPKEQPLEASENSRQFNNGYKDGPFSIGQTLRIKVGPLKGYLCRVLAMRRTGITVKLDSKQKVLTVQSEHLAEVQAKGISISGSGNLPQDSVQQLGLFGSEASSEGWNSGGTNRWNPEMEVKESSKDDEENPWGVKRGRNQNSSWGSVVNINNEAASDADQGSGWGKGPDNWNTASATKVLETGSSSWERSGVASSSKGAGSNWGKAQPGIRDNEGRNAGGTSDAWDQGNSADGIQTSGWGKKADDLDKNVSSGWNNSGWNGKSAENDKEGNQGNWGSLKLGTSCGEKQVGAAAEAGASWEKTISGPSEQWGQQRASREKQDGNDGWNSGKINHSSASGGGQNTGWGKAERIADKMDSDNSNWGSRAACGNGDNNANWTSWNSKTDDKQNGNLGKKNSWQSGHVENENANENRGCKTSGGAQSSGWAKVKSIAEKIDSDNGNWNSVSARGSGDTNSSWTAWNSNSDNKQNANWGKKNSWQSKAGDGDEKENGSENWGNRASGDNWMGGNGGSDSDRGGFRGRGRGERGGFRGRGRTDGERYGGRSDRGGFGGRGGPERGAFRGRGFGRRNQSSDWSNRNDFGKETSNGWNKGECGKSEEWTSNNGSGTWGSNGSDFGKDPSSGWNKGEACTSGGWTSNNGSGTSGRNKNDFGKGTSSGWSRGEDGNSDGWKSNDGSGTWGSNRNDFGKDTSSGWNRGDADNSKGWTSSKGSPWGSNKNGEGTNSEGWAGKDGSGKWGSNRNEFGKDTSSGWNRGEGGDCEGWKSNDGSGNWNKGSERGGFGRRGGSERGAFRGRGCGRRDQSGDWSNRNDFGTETSSGWNKGEFSNSDGWTSNNGSGTWGSENDFGKVTSSGWSKREGGNSDGWKSNDGSGTCVSHKNDSGKDTSFGWNKGEGDDSEGWKSNDRSGNWNKGSERGGFGRRGGSDRGAFRGRGRGRSDHSGEWSNRSNFAENTSSGWNKGEGSNSEGWTGNNGSGTWSQGSERGGFGGRGGSERGAFGGRGRGRRDQSGDWSNKNGFGQDTSSGWSNGAGGNSEGWIGWKKSDVPKENEGFNAEGSWGQAPSSTLSSRGWDTESSGWNKGPGLCENAKGSNEDCWGKASSSSTTSGWDTKSSRLNNECRVTEETKGANAEGGWGKAPNSSSGDWGKAPSSTPSSKGWDPKSSSGLVDNVKGSTDEDWGKAPSSSTTSGWDTKRSALNDESRGTEETKGPNAKGGWGKAQNSSASSGRDTEVSGWKKESGLTENFNVSTGESCWGKLPSSSTAEDWETKDSLHNKESGVTTEAKGPNTEGSWAKAPSSITTGDWGTKDQGLNKESSVTEEAKGSNAESCWGNGGWETQSSGWKEGSGVTEEAKGFNAEGYGGMPPIASAAGIWDTKSSALDEGTGVTEEAKGSNAEGGFEKEPHSVAASGGWDTSRSGWNKVSSDTEQVKGLNDEGGWGTGPDSSADNGNAGACGSGNVDNSLAWDQSNTAETSASGWNQQK